MANPGTVRERSKGHFELRAYVGDDPVTGRPKQVTKTYVHPSDAKGSGIKEAAQHWLIS